MPRLISAIATASGAARLSKPGGATHPPQHLMRPDHPKPFLAENPDHRCQEPVIAREGGPPDPRQDPRPLDVRPEIQKGRAPDRPHQHQLPALMGLQRRKDLRRRHQPQKRVRIRSHDRRIGESLQPDNEHVLPRGSRRRCHLARQRTPAGQDSQHPSLHHRHLRRIGSEVQPDTLLLQRSMTDIGER